MEGICDSVLDETIRDIIRRIEYSPEKYLILLEENKELKKMASGYGYRIDPIYKTRKMHTGMDFTADIGTEVYVTGDGFV